MNVSETRNREAAPIGHLVARIARDFHANSTPSWPNYRDAGELKSRLLRALNAIRRHCPSRLGVSRAQARHLIELAGTVAKEDLAATGGLLGGSNSYYATRLSVLPATITTIFRALRTAGLIEPHNPTANHRRSCHRSIKGHRDGRGYTLRPLVERLDELEGLAADLEQDAQIRLATQFETKQILAECTALALELSCSASIDAAEELRQADKAARRAEGVDMATAILQQAAALRSALHQRLETQLKTRFDSSENRDQTRKKSRLHHTAEQPSSVSVSAWRGSSSGDHRAKSSASAPEAGPENRARSVSSRGTELTCGLTLAEAGILFASARRYIPRTERHEEWIIAASHLGQAMNINPRLLSRAFETMGIERTLWSLHLVNWREGEGMIERDAAAYFNGMVTRAQRGQLDIDRSIWGLRTAMERAH